MTKTAYISTTIPYVNGAPHIGFAMEAVQADALNRWYKLKGFDTFLSAGTDENALKNVETAEKMNLTTQELVDQLSERYFALRETLNFSYDRFIRTTSEKHVKGAQKFWKLCKHDIYKKTYQGLYCVGCETFYKDGEFPDNICPEHNRKLEIVSEENYFFKLSKYVPEIKRLIETDELKILSDAKKSEILNMLNGDLGDFSISRPTERTKGWGIQVPGDDTQRIYVWFDALINYITTLDFAEDGSLYKKFWLKNKNRIHIVGKNVIKFHAIYWIGMLLSAKLPLPSTIYVHGFINSEGKKMSKSLGNVVSPFDLVQTYGTDAVRYYFLREIPTLDDGDFSISRMDEIYNSELANELGNLVMRITTLSERDGLVIQKREIIDPYDETSDELFRQFQLNKILERIFAKIKTLNKSIDEFAPWKKTPPAREEFLAGMLNEIHDVGFQLIPFIPESAQKIVDSTQGKITKTPQLFPKKA